MKNIFRLKPINRQPSSYVPDPAREWHVLPVFDRLEYGEAFLNVLKAQSSDSDAPGFSDVGIRNSLFTHILNLRPKSVLEIGTHVGTAAVIMGQALKLNNFGKLYSVEPQDHYYKKATSYISEAGLTEWAEVLNGFSTEDSILKRLKENAPFDIIFVDALHDYKQVKEEIKWCLELLSDNGFIFFHDTSIEAQDYDTEKLGGVRRAVVEASKSNPEFKLLMYEFPLWLNPCGAAIACKQRIKC